MPPPVPAGWRLRLAPGVRVIGGGGAASARVAADTRVVRESGAGRASAVRSGGHRGSILVGGSPLRILTLSDRGTHLLDGWLAGQPVGAAEGEGMLARRLLDAGLADPDPPARSHERDELTIVVPVYADPERLRTCLAPLAGRWHVIVVDDGSPDAGAIAAVAERFGVGYVRHRENRGPAAARNTGLRRADTPMVAFIDADCVPPSDFPGRLLDHLDDPAVALVAPRIVTSARQSGRIAAYERCRSALDMGPRPSLVRPYSPVWYVPSAAMVAKRGALGRGFDEGLSLGEDVDLVWRLRDAGWQVRYDPGIAVAHEDRVRPAAWYRRRVAYNESVAPLRRRHPDRVPVLFFSPVAAFAWGAAVGGLPAPILALTAVRAARLRHALGGRLPAADRWATRVAFDVTSNEARDLARALAGPWVPCAPFASRRPLALLLATMIVRDWLADRPSLDPLSYAALRLADESSRGVGIWLGCLRARDFRPLLPRRPPRPRDR